MPAQPAPWGPACCHLAATRKPKAREGTKQPIARQMAQGNYQNEKFEEPRGLPAFISYKQSIKQNRVVTNKCSSHMIWKTRETEEMRMKKKEDIRLTLPIEKMPDDIALLEPMAADTLRPSSELLSG